MVNLKKTNRLDIILFLILVSFIFLYFYNLGLPSIWNPNEAFYAETPREMIEKKDFLTPYFNYEYRFQKPILTYWLVLPWYYLFGLKEISARMVSAISATGGVLLTYWLGKTIWNNYRGGLFSAVLLAAAVDYNSLARYASTDMLLTALTTCSLVLFYKGYISKKEHQRIWYLMVYAACGLATLTKGPIGIVMPFLIIAAFFLIKKDFQGLKKFISLKGILIYFFVVLPWYLYMIYTYHDEFFSVIYKENVIRFTKKISGSSSPFFYVSVILANFFPVSIFSVPAFLWIFRNIKKRQHLIFPLVWFSVIIVFFSIARSKLPAYIMSSLPALSVLVGGWIHEVLGIEGKEKRIVLWLSSAILLFIIVGIFWFKMFLPLMNLYLIGIIVFLFFLSLFNIKKKIYYLSFIVSLTGMALFNLLFISDILPQIEQYRHSKDIAHSVKLHDPDKRLPFYCYEGCQKNLSFYLKRRVVRIKEKDALTQLLKNEKEIFLLLKKKTFDENYKGSGKNIIWQGLFYDKSESVFFKFLMDIKKKNIAEYVVIR
jgi:4-amino-4-deoxy-L-arabinose transferase-like glycosyltransferase